MHIDLSADERAVIAAQAGDVHADVAADGTVLSWSDDLHPIGLPLAQALVEDDRRLIGAVLASDPTGPHWLRLRDAAGHGRWMAVFAVPRASGWLVEFRDVRTLGPAAGSPERAAGIADRDQMLNEVAWLLSATPRTGKETAVVTCALTDLEVISLQHGAAAAAEVVDVITGRMSDALRSGDLVARIDVDRLLVILRGVHDLPGAVTVMERMQESLAEPIGLDSGDVVQNICVGVTLISRGESVDSVLDRSEGALDLAVSAGPGRIITSPPL